MVSEPLRIHSNVEASREPLPLPISSIYGNYIDALSSYLWASDNGQTLLPKTCLFLLTVVRCILHIHTGVQAVPCRFVFSRKCTNSV